MLIYSIDFGSFSFSFDVATVPVNCLTIINTAYYREDLNSIDYCSN